MSVARFKAWADPLCGENSTHAELRDIRLPGAGLFALITIANSNDRKPATFSPGSLLELGALLEGVRQRAASGEFAGVGVTGQHRCFVAGADLTAIKALNNPESARAMSRLGQEVFDTLAAMDVPTFAFINGAASAAAWNSPWPPATELSPPGRTRSVLAIH